MVPINVLHPGNWKKKTTTKKQRKSNPHAVSAHSQIRLSDFFFFGWGLYSRQFFICGASLWSHLSVCRPTQSVQAERSCPLPPPLCRCVWPVGKPPRPWDVLAFLTLVQVWTMSTKVNFGTGDTTDVPTHTPSFPSHFSVVAPVHSYLLNV